MVKKISHIGIASRSIAKMAEFYRELGLEVDTVEVNSEQKVKLALIRIGESAIELLEPTDDGSPIRKFLDRRGEGIHHISLQVEDLKETLARLKKRKVRLIDEEPRKGADGQLIGFVHPQSTGGVLIELCQKRGNAG